MDCELLEYFFDVTDADNEKCSNWENRRILEGMNAKNDTFNRYTRASKDIQAITPFSYWNNLKTFYGTDADDYARVTWDNIDVQYSLNALRKNQISLETFLKLNTSIGGWKPGREMQEENFWFFTGHLLPSGFSIWSHQNTTSHNPEKIS